MKPVKAWDEDGTRNANSDLIRDLIRLGYIPCGRDSIVLDPTYGLGVFWNQQRPDGLIASDLDPDKSPCGSSIDATDLPWGDGFADCIVLDPPYKLNGTPDPGIDARYGVDKPATPDQRMDLIHAMVAEAARVVRPGGTVLVKCQDQVVSGRVRWQTQEIPRRAERHGLRLADQLFLGSYRPQPAGRRQVHARRNYSTMLVFVREARP